VVSRARMKMEFLPVTGQNAMELLGSIDIYTFRRMVCAAELEACRAGMS
jgi:hypothetical protein